MSEAVKMEYIQRTFSDVTTVEVKTDNVKLHFDDYHLLIFPYSNKGFILVWYDNNGKEVDRKIAHVFSNNICDINNT